MVKKGTSYKDVDRLREIMGDSEHPGINDSRKHMRLLGLMRTKGRSCIIGTSKPCSPKGEPTHPELELYADKVRTTRKLWGERMGD